MSETADLARAFANGYRRALRDAEKAIGKRYRELRPTSQDWPLIVMDDLIDDAGPISNEADDEQQQL